MGRKGRLWLGAVLALGVILALVAGTAFADDPRQGPGPGPRYQAFIGKLAQILGKSEQEVQSALTQAQKELIGEAVAQGRIPEARGERLRERAERGGAPFFGPLPPAWPRLWGWPGGPPLFGPGPGFQRPWPRGAILGEVTKIEGDTLTVQTGRGEMAVKVAENTQVRKGREAASLADIQVGDRVLVQGRADEQGIIAARRVIILPAEAWPRLRGWPGVPPHGFRGLPSLLPAASKLLNLAPNELRAQLRGGRSLAEIAEAQGVGKQALIDALVKDFTERVERLEERGALGPERAARLLQNLPERVAKMVEKKKPSR